MQDLEERKMQEIRLSLYWPPSVCDPKCRTKLLNSKENSISQNVFMGLDHDR